MGIEEGLKQITLLNFWPQIVGPRFEKISKAISVQKRGDGHVLMVAVLSSSVSQELYMFKGDILRKLEHISKSLDFDIKDIIFSVKLWEEFHYTKKETKKPVTEVYKKLPSEKELEEIEVPESIVKSISDSIKGQAFESNELRERVYNTILNNIKLQIWKKNKGYPFCAKCGIPVNYRNLEGETLCPSCEYN